MSADRRAYLRVILFLQWLHLRAYSYYLCKSELPLKSAVLRFSLEYPFD